MGQDRGAPFDRLRVTEASRTGLLARTHNGQGVAMNDTSSNPYYPVSKVCSSRRACFTSLSDRIRRLGATPSQRLANRETTPNETPVDLHRHARHTGRDIDEHR